VNKITVLYPPSQPHARVHVHAYFFSARCNLGLVEVTVSTNRAGEKDVLSLKLKTWSVPPKSQIKLHRQKKDIIIYGGKDLLCNGSYMTDIFLSLRIATVL
jgi:hypothetical protein